LTAREGGCRILSDKLRLGVNMRLSFRLDEESARIWEKLREKHTGRTDAYILQEMLRQEDFRMQGNTKDDRLTRIETKIDEVLDVLRCV